MKELESLDEYHSSYIGDNKVYYANAVEIALKKAFNRGCALQGESE